MSLIQVEPFVELERMRRQVDRLLQDVFPKPAIRDFAMPEWEWEPPVEMLETENEVVIRAVLPNLDPKYLDITVTGDAITIKGETKNEEEQKGRNYYRRELKYGTFVRTLPFFAEVKTTDAKAAYKDGVLEVKVPKTERAKATSVKVKID